MTEREMITNARASVRDDLFRYQRMLEREERPHYRRIMEEELKKLDATLDSIDAYLGISHAVSEKG